MKLFKVDLIDLPTLIRHDGGVRHYQTPTGEKYPSVTTVLSAMQDKTHLIAWRKRIGEEEAARQTARASARGTATHLLCEKFVLNEPVDLTDQPFAALHLYKQLEGVLCDHVDNIRSSEGQLFSHKLKIAGSVDLVADYDGEAAIIDFKTSYKAKRKDWIENYFMQAALYSYMLFEMTGIYHPKLVVAIAVEEEPHPQVFIEHVKDWIPKAQRTVLDYHEKHKRP
jgi:ATP-dependent exoDNAse (exonuclease V) beta subunit